MINESKFDADQIVNIISDCEKHNIYCIVDDTKDGDVYLYDQINKVYATSSYLLNEVDATVFDVLDDDELYDEVMLPLEDKGFKEFAIKWNDLEKKEEEDGVYKTKGVAPIHGNFAESIEDDDESVGDGQLHIFKQNEQSYGKDYYIFILSNGDCYYCSETAPYGGESFFDGEISYSTRREMEDELDAIELELDEVPTDILKIAEKLDGSLIQQESWDEPIIKDRVSVDEEEVRIRWLIDNDDFGIFNGDIETFILDMSVIDDTNDMIKAIEKEIRDEYGIPYYYDREEWEFVEKI